MDKRSLVKRMSALAVAGGLVLGMTTTAFAAGVTNTVTPGATTTTLDGLKDRCESAIDRRLGDLGTLRTKVSSNTYLTAAHKTTLLGEITDEVSGLTALKAKIAVDTNRATLVTDCRSIVDHYRVYLLMIPQAHLLIAADASATIGEKLGDLATKLQADVNKAKAAGKNTADAQADLDAMISANASGKATAAGVPALISFTLPLNPADFAADHADVVNARQTMAQAHVDFVHARDDARKVIADLHALVTPKSVTGTVHS